MYALAISGSPRKGGNTEFMLREVLKPIEEAGWETEFIQVGGRPIRGCMACGKCFEMKNGKCVVDNDVFNGVMEKILRADAIILGSPIYFSDVSAEMKALLDRIGYVSHANGRALSGKIGAAVTAARRGGSIHAFDSINHMFLMSRMIVPGSTYWNMGFGLDKGEVSGDQEAMENMKDLGETIAWLGKAIDMNRDAFPKG